MDPDTERAAREIVRKAREGQKRPSRRMWIAALVVSAICIGALVIGFVTADRAPRTDHRGPIESEHGGLGSGLLLGLGVGIVIGSLLVVRRR